MLHTKLYSARAKTDKRLMAALIDRLAMPIRCSDVIEGVYLLKRVGGVNAPRFTDYTDKTVHLAR